MAVVVDASVLALSLLGTSPAHSSLRRRLAADTCHAPHLIDAEVGSVLRQRVLRGDLPGSAALHLLVASEPLIDHRYEMTGRLAGAAWELHRHLSFYDSLYAALAGALAVPLLTADRRLARAPELPCLVELMA